jgi:hypothetical protein
MATPVALLSGSGLRLRRSLFNKICDSSRLRYVNGVTSLDLNDGSTRALRHGTLRIRWDHLVFGGDQVPAWLDLPRWFADRVQRVAIGAVKLRPVTSGRHTVTGAV